MIHQLTSTPIQQQSYVSSASGESKGPEDKVSLYPPDRNCWVPVNLRDKVQSSETVSEAAQAAIDTVRNGEITQTVIAKGLPRFDWHYPAAPEAFRSVDHHVTFESEGSATTINFTTGLGHLAPVTPGETQVPGSITLGDGTALNNKELDGLLTSLYSRFSSQMSERDADTLQHLINTTAAVRFKDGSPEQVASAHQKFCEAVVQPQICPQF